MKNARPDVLGDTSARAEFPLGVGWASRVTGKLKVRNRRPGFESTISRVMAIELFDSLVRLSYIRSLPLVVHSVGIPLFRTYINGWGFIINSFLLTVVTGQHRRVLNNRSEVTYLLLARIPGIQPGTDIMTKLSK